MSSRTRLKSVSDRESAADMGMRSFYNRTSAVVARATGVMG